MPEARLDTTQKAQAINFDRNKYGTFAEIGAGQEVARWFFQAGGAAGTVAKSISAYDMQVSDAIYGKSSRYVSRDRLQTMLDYASSKSVKLVAYMYPILAFLAEQDPMPPWIINGSYSYLASPASPGLTEQND